MTTLQLDNKLFRAYPLSASRCLFVSNQDPFDVLFFLHDKRDEEGHNGRIFEFETVDGVHMTIKGPWASNPDYVKDTTGLKLEEYLDDDGVCKFRLAGLVLCEDHTPKNANYWPFKEYRSTVGFCTKCGRAVHGLYNTNGDLVG